MINERAARRALARAESITRRQRWMGVPATYAYMHTCLCGAMLGYKYTRKRRRIKKYAKAYWRKARVGVTQDSGYLIVNCVA